MIPIILLCTINTFLIICSHYHSRKVHLNHGKHIIELYKKFQPYQIDQVEDNFLAPLAEPEDDYLIQSEAVEQDTLPLTGHLIAVGQTGSGKSNFAMSQIIRRICAQHLIYVIDTKNEIGPIFKKYCTKITDQNGAEDMINRMLQIAQDRRTLFSETTNKYQKPCRDIGEYKKVTGRQLPIITLLVEELIVLMGIIDQEVLVNLLVLGRSAGVFVLALSQYIKADVLDRKGSINFNTRVYLGKWDQISTQILFGSISKKDIIKMREFCGPAGSAIIQDQSGNLSYQQIPQIHDHVLEPYIKGEAQC